MEDSNELDADDIGAFGITGHHAQKTAVVGKPHQGAERLEDAAFGEVPEHRFHHGDAIVHGEEGLYLFFIYI
jgi:hypothetical protein